MIWQSTIIRRVVKHNRTVRVGKCFVIARGCLRREYQLENRKTAHLRLCDPAQPMIAAGRSAQEQFGAALLDGFTPEELEHMQRSMERIRKNVEKYLEDKNNDNVD